MNEVKWIKLSVDIFDDEKIKVIRKNPNGNDITLIWIMLLTLAGRSNDSGLLRMNNAKPYTTDMISCIFDVPIDEITNAIQIFEQYGMIEINNGVITISNWGKHQNFDQLENRREYMRNYMQDYRNKQKELTTVNSKHLRKVNSKVNVNSADIDKDIDIDKDNKIYCANRVQNAPDAPNTPNSLFEKIWAMYPHKRGKGQISDTNKKKLTKISLEEWERIIDRYKNHVMSEKQKGFNLQYQNGSTFFNSGYVDYTDENYKSSCESSTENKTRYGGIYI